MRSVYIPLLPCFFGPLAWTRSHCWVMVPTLTLSPTLANNFNGDNLLECDQAVLKELGIKKIGDRVRIFVAIKSLRTKTYSKQRRRNRVCSSVRGRRRQKIE